MNLDPSTNHVVFVFEHSGKQETVIGSAPTKAANSIEQAWVEAQRKSGLAPRQVKEIYSEWEPTEADSQFILATFPPVAVSYSFPRPQDDKWEEAFALALQQMEEAARQADETEGDGIGPLPVLRNRDPLARNMVHRPVTDHLVICLALVGKTPSNTIGIDYVMKNRLAEIPVPEAEIWEDAFANLTVGLRVNACQEQGETFFTLERKDGFAASAWTLPDFPKRAAEWVQSRQFILAFPNPNLLFLCASTSTMVSQFTNMVVTSDYTGSINLTPSVLEFDGMAFRILAQRPDQR
ncbi:MAG: hypothetical protein K1Y36_26365 [Blastocatellia bacterium]|nr:hypothetical protein [Blastocatellia bacterium]